jgi:hypothetical protein
MKDSREDRRRNTRIERQYGTIDPHKVPKEARERFIRPVYGTRHPNEDGELSEQDCDDE